MSWFYEHYKDASAIGIHTTKLVHEERSEYQSIKVFDTVAHGRLLTLDDMVMLTELDEFVYHDLITHVPLCIHPDPKQVLIVGGGDGGCVREALKHPGVERIVQCEIDQRVTDVCREYIPSVAGHVDDPRVELVFEDAIAYVRRHPDTFDAVLVDSTEPIGPAEALFGRQFYADLKNCLREGGVVSAQAESPFYAPDVLRGLFGEVRGLYEHVTAYYGVIPTYPGGLWTFLYASDAHAPDAIDLERAAALDARYFDARLAKGAFALPRFVRDLVEPAAK